jgi:hypothetical protein
LVVNLTSVAAEPRCVLRDFAVFIGLGGVGIFRKIERPAQNSRRFLAQIAM